MSFSFSISHRALLAAALVAGARIQADEAGNAVQTLPALHVAGAPSLADSHPLPQVTERITALHVRETVNIIDTEDAVKYLPSVFLRKRNYGDSQPVMATRVWGVSSSARSLVYADGVLLSALIANNNNLGAPRWGFVAPAEIERVDLMYGPFAAAYPGNSMGAVLTITTRQPERAEASLQHATAWQQFDHYGTHRTFRTRQTAAATGDRLGGFSFWASANYQDSHSQPLSYISSANLPAGTTGGFAAANKLGQPAPVVGAGGLLHTCMTNAKVKAAYDFTPMLRAAYTFGLWSNEAASDVDTYLRDPAGQPTFAGLAGFASGCYELSQRHSGHSVSVKTATRSRWDFEAAASRYRMDRDRQRSPVAATVNGTGFGAAGRAAVLSGTGWSTLDVKSAWRPDASEAAHAVSFGAHDDRYNLTNPTFDTGDWKTGAPRNGVATQGDGKTRTQALWLEDIWRVTKAVTLTLGARHEVWRAYDGLNRNGRTVVRQPDVRDRGFSPKASAAWHPSPAWRITGSFGQAYRFATAAELYQLVSTGTTFTAPKPDLKPDNVRAGELRLDRMLVGGRVRLALFQDDVRNAIVAQFNPLVPGSTQVFSFLSNVDRVRARGAELAVEKNHLVWRGFSLSGSATYLDARTLALSGGASPAAPAGAAIGKRLPNIPEWRASVVATYRPDQRWTFTLAGRYSGMLFTTLDNTDVNPNTWQGFGAWFVADARIHCRLNRRWSASLGADNLLNRKYFVFHPFPQRTVVAEVRWGF